ncbi:MAG: Gfo/Idh/MocA family oxidoreductase [Ruminococcaceae bacterium]|nr:Gfo/Idh/MocA family oxidoreductase [Oscillospiraceae bacterium]
MEKKKIRFAVIGTGIGSVHIDGIKKIPNIAECVAVCDIVEEYAVECAKKFNIPKYYTDYKEMYKEGGFDCVIVGTPDQCHLEQSVAALEAGYHVLCEKPLAMYRHELDAIVDAAKKSGKKFMVGQVGRKTPAFALAKQLVDEGVIGNLFYVESEYAHDYSVLKRGEWRKDPNYLRHAVVGGGCHAMDLLRWIAGNPTEVFAYSNHKVLTDWPVDDCTIAVLKYPNNVIGKVMTSIGCKRPYTMHSSLYGDKGTIVFDNTSTELIVYQQYQEASTGKYRYRTIKYPVVLNNHNMTAEVEDMCKYINGEAELDLDAVEGANTVVVCLAAVESSATGKPVVPEYYK